MKTMLLYPLILMSVDLSSQNRPLVCQYKQLAPVIEHVSALAKFAFQLDEAIAAEKPRVNIVFSPTSIDLALALLEAGANGETGREIRNILHGYDMQVTLDVVDFQENFYSLQHHLRLKNSNATLNIANGLFLKNDINIKGNYQNYIKCYETEVSDLPIDNEQARQKVNEWVSEKTMQKIPELFKEGVINEETKLVLANALYLKASWKNPFSFVAKDQFYRFGDTKDPQTVSFARVEEYYKTWENNGYRAVVLPYLGDELDMVLIKLPENLDHSLFNKQSHEIMSLIEKRKQKKSLKLKLSVPKFEIRTPTDLKSILQKLGFKLIFSNADFGRISDTLLNVDAVVHEAFIKVDENGTDAAAATGVSMGRYSAEAEPELTVTFDRPFLFYILHKPTKAILFMGRVNYIEGEQKQ